jgi:hypothetical protein
VPSPSARHKAPTKKFPRFPEPADRAGVLTVRMKRDPQTNSRVFQNWLISPVFLIKFVLDFN